MSRLGLSSEKFLISSPLFAICAAWDKWSDFSESQLPCGRKLLSGRHDNSMRSLHSCILPSLWNKVNPIIILSLLKKKKNDTSPICCFVNPESPYFKKDTEKA